jgi:hypothetical protein
MNRRKPKQSPEKGVRAGIFISAILLFAALSLLACGAKKDLEQNIPIQYEMRQVEEHYGNCDDSNAGCAYILIRYPAIIQAPTKAAEDSLNDFIKAFIMKNSETDNALGFQALINNFLGEYEKLEEERPEYKTHWYDRKNVTVVSDTFEIMSLAYSEDIFTGGAHPNNITYYANLTHYGRRLELSDLLKKDYWPVLNNIADSIFRKVNNIPRVHNLQLDGYWFEDGKFHLNENFYISPAGLTFLFNPYEIGPYSMGSTKLTIPYSKIKNYILKDGPLRVVLKNL